MVTECAIVIVYRVNVTITNSNILTEKLTACRCISSISQEIAYHPLEEWHIIKPQERYTLKRDDIQYRLAGIDDIQPKRADDIPNLRFG